MAKVKAPDFTVIVDTREQLPYEFYEIDKENKKRVSWNIERTALKTGDYSIVGHESIFTVERKSLNDFLGCVFSDRFDNELHRLSEIPHSYILIESSLDDLAHPERAGSSAHPQAVIGKVISYSLKHNIQIILAHSREYAQFYVRRLMLQYWDKFFAGELHSMKGA